MSAHRSARDSGGAARRIWASGCPSGGSSMAGSAAESLMIRVLTPPPLQTPTAVPTVSIPVMRAS